MGFKSESPGPFQAVLIWVASYGYNLQDTWAIAGGLLVGCPIWILNQNYLGHFKYAFAVMIWVASYGCNLQNTWAITRGLLVGCPIWILNQNYLGHFKWAFAGSSHVGLVSKLLGQHQMGIKWDGSYGVNV